MKKKRVLSLFMSFLIAFSIMPIKALAADDSQQVNLAKGKTSFTVTSFDDTLGAQGYYEPAPDNPTYNSTDFSILTDGVYGDISNFNDRVDASGNNQRPTWFRFLRDTGRDLVLDLGQTDTINSISMGLGNNRTVGIVAPPYLRYYVSNDGTNYKFLGKAMPDAPVYLPYQFAGNNTDKRVYKMDTMPDGSRMNIQARYIKIEFIVDLFVFADEIEVLGKEGIKDDAKEVTADAPGDSNIVVNEYPTPNTAKSSDVKEQFLLYTGYGVYPDPSFTDYNADQLSKMVGYVDTDGKIKDWMFDSTLLMPCGVAQKNMTTWEGIEHNWLNYIFKNGKQLDQLDQAVAKVNEATGTNKKLNLNMWLPYCSALISKFSDFNGNGIIEDNEKADSWNPLDFADVVSDPNSITGRTQMFNLAFANRTKFMDWYIDQVISRFNAKGYKNIELKSFYWYDERLYYGDGADLLVKHVADKIKPMGYYFTWIPYVGTASPAVWKEAGFTSASLQPNYAFGGTDKSIKKIRTKVTGDLAKKYGMTVEMERSMPYGWTPPTSSSKVLPDKNAQVQPYPYSYTYQYSRNVQQRRWAQYLNDGITCGYMNDAFHTYYLDILSIFDMANSKDPVMRAGYDRMYEFIKGTYQRRYLMDIVDNNPGKDKSGKYIANFTETVSLIDADNFYKGEFEIRWDPRKMILDPTTPYTVDGTVMPADAIKVDITKTSTLGTMKVSFDITDKSKAISGDTALASDKKNYATFSPILKLNFKKSYAGDPNTYIGANIYLTQDGKMTDTDGNEYLNWSESGNTSVLMDGYGDKNGSAILAEEYVRYAEFQKAEKKLVTAGSYDAKTGDCAVTAPNYDQAYTFVNNSLKDAIDPDKYTALKQSLLARLAALKIDLMKATAKVERAEFYWYPDVYEKAVEALNALPISDKAYIQPRLNAIKPYIDTIVQALPIIQKVENEYNESDFNTAMALVNKLIPHGMTKDLNARLLVKKAEAAFNTDNYSAALTAANAVTFSAPKAAYLARLGVTKAEASLDQADIAAANTLVNALPNGIQKTELAARLTSISNITGATNAVAKAEGSSLPADIDAATVLVNALPDSAQKTALLDRLTKVLTSINATDTVKAINAVVKAEASHAAADINAATVLVNALSDGVQKTALLGRLTNINITIAANAVTKAEVSLIKADIDAATALVNALPNGAQKTALSGRLTNIVNYINATALVVTAETSLTQTDIDNAAKAVNALSDGEQKTALSGRLAKINITIAANAVIKAEGSLAQADIDAAATLVNALPNGEQKTTLSGRLAKVTNIINATNAVTKAEGSSLPADIDAATILVNTLPDSAQKTALLDRLTKVLTSINAADTVKVINAVVKAEGSHAQTDIDAAAVLANALPEGIQKAVLLDRLTKVTNIIKATDAVIKAEGSLAQADLGDAAALVSALPDGIQKTALLDRLVASVTKEVIKAETSLALADISNSTALVNTLPNGIQKTALLDRLTKVSITVATNAVTKAEASHTQTDIDTANTLVNLLPDNAQKTALLDRISEVQKHLNDGVNDKINVAFVDTPISFEAGKTATVKIRATNNDTDANDLSTTLIIALYTTDGNKLVNYSVKTTILMKSSSQDIIGTIGTPADGNYKIKCFIWDSLDKGNPFANSIEIPVIKASEKK